MPLRKLKTAATGMSGMESIPVAASGGATALTFILRTDFAIGHCKMRNAVFPYWVAAILSGIDLPEEHELASRE